MCLRARNSYSFASFIVEDDRRVQRSPFVPYEGRIELIAVADDSLTVVQEAAGELRDAPVAELRENIEKAATSDLRENSTDDEDVCRVTCQPC